MAQPKYIVEILDQNLNPITRLQGFAPLNATHETLAYSHKLSAIGLCRFRISTKDDKFKATGDIFQPFANHVRVLRNGVLAWQGIIVDNPHRTAFYIEVVARTYSYLLQKVLIRHDPADGNGAENFRTFKTGTLANAVQAMLTEAKADVSANSIIRQITIGSIENPPFPLGAIDLSKNNIGGKDWNFATTGQNIQFDWKTVFYGVSALGVYSNCDFELTDTLVFNFKQFLGNQRNEIQFEYGKYGNISDYDIPLNGSTMANYLVGIGADNDTKLFQTEQQDNSSIAQYGKLADVAAFSDTKNATTLGARLTQTLKLISTPDAELNVLLNERAHPLGTYRLGDIVTIKIIDHFINLNVLRRIVGINVNVDQTGTETIKLITNQPKLNGA